MVFGVEKELKVGDGLVDWKAFSKWKTKPESVRMHIEVLAKVDGEKDNMYNLTKNSYQQIISLTFVTIAKTDRFQSRSTQILNLKFI
ncbi:hypothetical protein FRX31_002349 [Thalictrum thalictroides]|uniref:Uncharacterized protein n=1 Tax=Thalictrum thalictroides TaxID=46969 RepID=A0A7J6XGC4_THATH|nr:hypothetical protein FRX31_002349 [Thalictrum thalictroides]